jgi:LmbE family N-acetylglucosaminyl deacetylase
LKTVGLLQTAKVFNRTTLVWEPGAENVLVLAPHMDDEVIGCGGALAKHVARGAQVTVVFLTDGGASGTVAPAAGSSSLVGTRRREAGLALQTLGVQNSLFLDGPDGALRATPELTGKLRALLERQAFAVIYLPFFLEEHPDHRAASDLLLDAARGLTLDAQCMGYEVWTTLFPNCLVNIDATVQVKRDALNHYRSQLAEADYAHTQLGLNAYRSAAFHGGSCRYAEAFCALPLERYRAMYQAFVASKA